MMDYNEDNSDHDDTHTSKLKDKVEQEEEEEDYSQGESVDESQVKNNGSSNNTDPLTEAFNSFHTLQEALKNELERFQELGKETTSSSLESSSCIHAGHERTSASSSSSRFGSEKMGLTSLDSEILNLVNNVEHLETKLDEAKCVLEVKESQIRELESTISVSDGGTEIGMEEIFKQKMEAEVEYIIYSRSVANRSRKIKLIEEEKTLTENQAHKMLSKLEKAETKAENLKNQAQDLQKHCVEITEVQEVKSLKNRVFKKSWCLLLQLGLMYMIMFNSQSESEFVVPT